MPVYEYQCEKCENVHELMQKISDEPLKKCPDCGGPVFKLMSLSSFALKGGGWYKEGYGGKNGSAKKAVSEGSSAKTDSGSKKSDSGSKNAPSSVKSSGSKPDSKSSSSKSGSGSKST